MKEQAATMRSFTRGAPGDRLHLLPILSSAVWGKLAPVTEGNHIPAITVEILLFVWLCCKQINQLLLWCTSESFKPWEESKTSWLVNVLQVCHGFSIITLSFALIKTFTWVLAYCRGGVTQRRGRNNFQDPSWWGGQIRSQIMTLLFTWSQWMEDYPRASETGPGHEDRVCGFDKVGSSQSSAPRELDATTDWMLSGCQRPQHVKSWWLNSGMFITSLWNMHCVMIQYLTPPALRKTQLSECNINKRWTESLIPYFFIYVIIIFCL